MAKTYELVVYSDDGAGVTSALTEYDRGEDGALTYVGRAWLGVEETAAAVAVLTNPAQRQRWADFLGHREA
jgi:hypothetical protein